MFFLKKIIALTTKFNPMEKVILLFLVAVLAACSLFVVGFVTLLLMHLRQLVNNWIESLEPDED